MFAALDAAILVSREGEVRSWKVDKAKDGKEHRFRLNVVEIGSDEDGDEITSRRDAHRSCKARSSAATGRKTIAQLTKTKTSIEARAERLLLEGQDDARHAFTLDPSRPFVHDRIMDHMLSLVGAPDGTGTMKLRELLRDDGEAAAVFANVKPYLLRMNAENLDKLHFEMIERYAPAAFKKMATAPTFETSRLATTRRSVACETVSTTPALLPKLHAAFRFDPECHRELFAQFRPDFFT